jgi:hypothetical protein
MSILKGKAGEKTRVIDRDFRLHALRARRSLAGYARKSWGWIKQKAEHAGLHDWLMVLFTAVLTLVAIEQGILAWQNSQSSTAQMGKIIDAANRIEDAADSFSGSASHINNGVSDAVTKLQTQADELERARRSSESNSERALNATVDNFRLDQRAWLEIRLSTPRDGDTAGLKTGDSAPLSDERIHSLITNSGKTPAKDIVAVIATWTRFGDFPPEEAEARWFEKIIALRKEHKLDFLRPGQGLANIARDAPASLWPPGRNYRDQVGIPELDNVGVIAPGDSGYELPELGSLATILSIVYGEITYKDIYHKTHTTRFCFMRHPSILRLRPKYEACDVFNNID